MNGGEIIKIPSASKDFPSGQAILYKADSDRYIVIQPGLGVDVSDSQMAKALIQAVVGKYNVVLADHPGWGINGGMLHPKNFTTHACKKHSMNVLMAVLGLENCKKLGIVGGSLGAFSMKEALSHIWDPRIQFFIKSGIVSYEAIVKRLGGVENVLKNILQVQGDGFGSLQVNPSDEPVRLHENFIRSIPQPKSYEFRSRLWYPTKAWHGTKDPWGTVQEIQDLCGPENVTLIDAGHGLPAEVDQEIIQELITYLEKKN